jgi:hypothetical protein
MRVVAQSIPRPTLSGALARQWWPGAAARASAIAVLAIAGILTHVALRWGADVSPAAKASPLYVVLVAGGVPLVLSLMLKLVRREFGSDLLAGISIVAAVLLQEYLAGALVVLSCPVVKRSRRSRLGARPRSYRRSPVACRSSHIVGSIAKSPRCH